MFCEEQFRSAYCFHYIADCETVDNSRLTEMNSKEYLEHHAAMVAEKQ